MTALGVETFTCGNKNEHKELTEECWTAFCTGSGIAWLTSHDVRQLPTTTGRRVTDGTVAAFCPLMTCRSAKAVVVPATVDVSAPLASALVRDARALGRGAGNG
jgi:hypothetical protein